ncbi:MAG: GDSL-type esterase/lipase family protein [bacterium]|nr:GDSL-type esterase/lipase family protein [bacterium]
MQDNLSIKKRIIFSAIPFLVFIGILGIVEGIVRSKNPYISSLEFFTKANFDKKVKLEHGQQVFEGDALLGWRLMSNLSSVHWDFTPVSTNQQGMRYAKNIGDKKGDTMRILALGDSVVFGYRVPVAFPANPDSYDHSWLPFPALMENYVREKNPGKNIEVIPMAVPGYSTYQGLKWLERDIEELKPDLVIVHFGWNDTEPHAQYDRVALSHSWFRLAQRSLISQSQALIYLTKKKAEVVSDSANTPAVVTGVRVPKEEYVENMLAIENLAEQHGAKTLILGQVYRDAITNVEQQPRIADYRQSLAAAAHQADIPYLEIEKLTEKGYPDNAVLFGESIHPNHLGHQLMAQEIIEAIKRENLLEKQELTL